MDGAAAGGGSGELEANRANAKVQQFDPSRMIGIMKRKALIKKLAAVYHADCVASCKELLQLQTKWKEVCILHIQTYHDIAILKSSVLYCISLHIT